MPDELSIMKTIWQGMGLNVHQASKPGQNYFDWVSDLFDDEAHVLNEAEANKAGPCSCYQLKDREVYFKSGMLGPLSQQQQARYCRYGRFVESDAEVVARVQATNDKHQECKETTKGIADREERLKVWTECMEAI